ncbi:MAG: hypothetical protein ACTHMS_15165 [Jatrophihabitans sp.]|uniref:hypothetical protein n=1 Tax=Jatrophihabitans sp. TaxID=1932789 RepID=UPI003F81A3B5
MFRREKQTKRDFSSISVYRRRDAFWLIRSVQTTDGLWMAAPNQVAPMLPLDVERGRLGTAILDVLAEATPVVRHPSRDEWKAIREDALRPLMQQAKVRSWRSFESFSKLVTVRREGSHFHIEAWRKDAPKVGAWEPDMATLLDLTSPTAVELGTAVAERFA